MRATDIKPGVYVRAKRLTAGDSLYEVEEVTPGGHVLLRNCMVPIELCRGEHGALMSTRLRMTNDFVVVVPAPDELEALVAA
jgi:hypothetical protein